ncbi:PilX N-terminal domain-containing pilus assembly protein [Glaciimonas sp. Gout2]|uniref:pilus assembly PilX family protein n=1 Tax=unclassified Glaciimonas TaxID=2644401 RepID=UPI002AB348A5|nr:MULTISPECIES: PilX N-terminal domain-containing pilus assembly protein [unclassified Glaciimonas]MDY7547148.1 PilX N-terminal domain-containing pilus assembly protein [Glaciimonas sp. CA11.2]MEB0011009.1 PilX N-terminal domain-containing pilus assembly protein [Glaciimonas sp. Cout2]MEB0083260.1 PilX N-terminal domain-containing pilus assembly protein [Glaciimonas sp. Gout2]
MHAKYSIYSDSRHDPANVSHHAPRSSDRCVQSDHHFFHHSLDENASFSKIKPARKLKINLRNKTISKTITRQAGIALPLVLIFFVVMTLLGVTEIRNATSGESLAGNARNQQMAFQAAEQALRHCEIDLQKSIRNGARSDYEGLTLKSIYPKPYGVKSSPKCRATDISDTLQLGPTEVSRDESIFVYQITARGTGPSDNAVVMLQSSLRFKK